MLDQLRRDISTRLDELVGEADKLRHALAALDPRQRNATTTPATKSSSQTPGRPRTNSRPASTGSKRTPASTTATPTRSSTPKPRSGNAKRTARSSERTQPGATKAAVLAALASGEAMTATEVATKTRLPAATVSTTLSRLAKTGEVTKANRGYQANRPTTHPATDNGATATPK
jgi:predicted Rossmann fold nucleotide-binding protein DprA/Smf involved in DNA uptake